MGQQTNFFMLSEDETQFLEFVSQMNIVKFLKQQYENHFEEAVLEKISAPTVENHETIFLWDSRQKMLPEYINHQEICHYDKENSNLIHTGMFKYYIDISQAPVIEFQRSFIRKDDVLVPGRIWADMNRVVNNRMENKGDDFISLYKYLAKYIRTNSKHYKNTHEYFCSFANKWFVNGGKVFLSASNRIVSYEDF